VARFTNVSGEELLLFARAGQAESLPVPPGGTVDVPGEVTAETDDAVVVGDGDVARAWPKALWQVEGGGPGVQAPQLDDDSRAEAEQLANDLAQRNVAASQGTAADRAGQAAAAPPATEAGTAAAGPTGQNTTDPDAAAPATAPTADPPGGTTENVTAETGGTTSKGE